MTIDERKTKIKMIYSESKEAYRQSPTNENWKRFCEAKRNCMLLGVRI